MLIQETWLYSFQENIITANLKNSTCFSTSGMNDNDVGRVGRPFGGLAIVWKQSLPFCIKPVPTISKRLCVVSMKLNDINLLLFSVYMPINDNSEDSLNDYENVLNEMSSIINLNEDCRILIGGDFNLDFVRDKRSRVFDSLTEFLSREALLCHDEVFDIDQPYYTFESGMGFRSAIDHFIFSDDVYTNTESFNVSYDGHNLSDHNPISMVFRFESVEYDLADREENSDKCQNYDWGKVDDICIDNFKFILDDMLCTVNLRDEVIQCNDLFCTDHKEFILDYINEIIQVISIASDIAIPKLSKNKNNGKPALPGWNRYVRFYKIKSMFWSSIWMDAGRPSNGELSNVMKYSKKCYKNAIKFIKHHRENIIKENVYQTLCRNDSNFWKEVNKLKLKDKTKTKVLDGAVGDEGICKVFQEKYKKLYNEFDDRNNDVLDCINLKILSQCVLNKCNFDHTIGLNDVTKAISEIKRDKHDPIFNLNSNCLKYGSDLVFSKLAVAFNSMFIHGVSSSEINKSMIIPIVKNKRRSASDSDNYRGISLSTVISKLLEIIILNRIKTYLTLNDRQFGFRENHSTGLCASMLNQTVQYYLHGGSNVYIAFLDASKAFDRVKYSKLFECLLDRGLCPSFIRFIFIMYNLNNACIDWNRHISESFKVANGVKQGGILSPLLFAVYLDKLLDDITSGHFGCHIGGMSCSVLAYADDIALLAPSVTALNKLIDKCAKYGDEFSVKFNPNKSKVMVFSNLTEVLNININLNRIRLEQVTSFKYLGFDIINKNYVYSAKEADNDMKIKCNVVCHNFCSLDTMSRIKLFNSKCMSLYGFFLWDISGREIERLSVTWRKCCRQVMQLPPRTHNVLIPSLMGTDSVSKIIEGRFVNFIQRGLSHCNIFVNKVFRNTVSCLSSVILKNLDYVLSNHRIPYIDILKEEKIEMSCSDPYEHMKIEIIKELIHMKDFKFFDFLSKNKILLLINHLCTV